MATVLVRSAFCSILTESAPVDLSPRNKKAREEVRLFLEDYVDVFAQRFFSTIELSAFLLLKPVGLSLF
jgi:hypothetical protein